MVDYHRLAEGVLRFRKALIVNLVLIIALTMACFYFSESIMTFLGRPLGEKQLIFLAPAEGLITKVKISLFCSLLLLFPVYLYQLAGLMRPRLSKRQYYLALLGILPISAFFYAGAAMAYLTTLPLLLPLLVAAGESFMTASLTGNGYFSFIFMVIGAIGLLSQLPLLLALLYHLGVIDSRTLSQRRKTFYPAMLVCALVIFPAPDILMLLTAAIPLLALFEATILVMKAVERIKSLAENSPLRRFLSFFSFRRKTAA